MSAQNQKYVLNGEEVEILANASGMTHEQLVEHLLPIYGKTSESSRFYVVDLGCVRQQFLQWRHELPRVQPFYAIKCNPNPVVLRLLADLGANFDCASLPEIDRVLGLGDVAPERIIFANPCKFPEHIRKAHEKGVDLMTFDNVDEVDKIKAINPKAKLVMRIATDDRNALCKFSTKFGARPWTWENLLAKVKESGLALVGVSFHVGSGSSDDKVYPSTLAEVKRLFDLAKTFGFTMNLVDIGGGFPGDPSWTPNFPQLAKGIRESLDALFPPEVKIIGEPGRYMIARSHTLVCRVFARRMPSEKEFKDWEETKKDPMHEDAPTILYYIDEGWYQSFNCITNDHFIPNLRMLSRYNVEKRPTRRSTIFGPTCDSIDCMYKGISLPEINIGEWIYFPMMGAYTVAPSCPFNGFMCNTIVYVDTDYKCCDAVAKGKDAITSAMEERKKINNVFAVFVAQ